MKKLLKVVFVTLFSLVLLIGIAGYVILKNVDINQYKGVVEQKVAEATGRKLSIGNIAVKVSLVPTVELQEVLFANASWSKNEYMAKVGAVDVSVAVMPLINGEYVISKLLIKDAEVNLEESAENGANWVFDTPNQAETEVKEEKSAAVFSLVKDAYAEEIVANTSDNAVFSQIVIKQVALENVKINYTDKTAKTQNYDIKNFSLEENEDDNLDLSFNVNDGLYSGKGTIGALKLLNAESGYPVKLTAEVMGIGITTDTTLFDVMGDIRFKGNVSVTKFLGKNSGYDESADVSFDGNLKKIDAVINEVTVAANKIKGDVYVDLSNKLPFVRANLASDKIDLATFGAKKKTAWNFSVINEAKATNVIPAEVIPYKALYSVNADVDVNIVQMMNKNALLVKDLVINAKLNNGAALLSVSNGVIAGGTVKANASLNAGSKSVNLKADIIKVNILKLLETLDIKSQAFNFVSGSDTDLYINVSGKGNTYAAVAESLDGQIALIMDKSNLHMGNIGLLKGNIISQLLNTLKVVKNNDDLKLKCAVVRADFKDGLATFPSGIAINADKFTVVANGDINLKNDKINLSIKPFGGKLTETNIAKALSSLVKLTGTLSEPKIGVDTANAVKNIVGATMTGPVYLGAQMVMENDNSPCYTALKDTGYESRFPKSENVVKSTGQDVGKVMDDSVGMVKDTAKGLLNLLSGSQQKAKNAE